MDDAVAETALVEQLQVDAHAVRERRVAAADDHR